MFARCRARLVLVALLLALGSSLALAGPPQSGEAYGLWQYPSRPGAADGWASGFLVPAGSDEPLYLLQVAVARNSREPLDWRVGNVSGWLYDATGTSDEPLYYVEGYWRLFIRLQEPVGSGELTIYTLEGKAVGSISIRLSEAEEFAGTWEIVK